MRRYVKAWPQRVWAVEGANGAGRPLAQRLVEAGEQVVLQAVQVEEDDHRTRVADKGATAQRVLEALEQHGAVR